MHTVLALLVCCWWIDSEPIRPMVKSYWVGMQVMDDDETLFAYLWNFPTDCRTCEERFAKIGPDTPPSVARHHIPKPDTASDNLWWIGEYRKWLNACEPYRSEPEQEDIRRLLVELDGYEELWRKVRDMRWFDAKGHRLRLQEIRDLLGRDNFYAGRWPNALPDAAYKYDWHILPDNWENP